MDISFTPIARSNPETVAIGCFGAICREWLGDRLLDFAKTHPAVSVGVQDMTAGELLSAVRGGAISLAILPGAPGPGLGSMPLWGDRVLLGVASDRPLAERAAVTQGEIAKHLILVSSGGAEGALDQFLLRRLFPAGARPDLSVREVSAASIGELVSKGEGVALLPAIQAGRWRGVDAVEIASPAASFVVHACWRPDAMNETLKALIAAFAVHCASAA